MKPETSEKLFVSSLFKESIEKNKIPQCGSFDVDRLTGDASTRSYYRILTNSTSYVVCLTTPEEDIEKEIPFLDVQGVLNNHKVRVPQIFDKNLAKGYLLEEDLGDTTLLKRMASIDSPKEEFSFYKRAIDQMITIHGIETTQYQQYEFPKLQFDFEKLISEMQFSVKFFIDRLIERRLTPEESKLINESLAKVCNELANQKQVLTHRDYHSRNIMILGSAPKEEQVIIDFQDARMGIPQYDLVSLLEDAYYDLDPKNREELKRYYWDNFLKDQGFQKDFEQYQRLYNLMAIQRVFKAIGSFSFIYADRKDKRYLKYIGFAYEKLKHFLFEFDELSDLRKTLTQIYYEY
ncbi:MAG: phosphotransferase [Halobacteriovoraceae bacterium]|jgi:N-acetylmuramate 1-kinase|nr:phosphotransferase [Halobacteriovoraceae bacterium]MBT5093457.1 phosphotransferase [Halobacteriovoraceae bacterium]